MNYSAISKQGVLLFIIAVITPSALNAETIPAGKDSASRGAIAISGRVLDSLGNPLSDALVTSTTFPGKTRKAMRTDKAGTYRFVFSRNDTLYNVLVQKIGFLTSNLISVKPTGSASIEVPDIILIPFIRTLTDVSVLGGKRPAVGARKNDKIGLDFPELDNFDRVMLNDFNEWLRQNSMTVLGPGGFSVAGTDPDQNNILLGGSTVLGSSLPSLLPMRVRLAIAPFDVSEGQFSGGQLSFEPSEFFSEMTLPRRRLALSGTGPWIQLPQRSAAGPGNPFQYYKVALYGSQPLIYGKMSAAAALDISNRHNNISTLFGADAASLQRLGLSSDSVSRLRSILQDFHLPLGRGPTSSRNNTSSSGYLAVSYIPRPGFLAVFRLNGELNRSQNEGASLLASQASLSQSTAATGNAQLRLTWDPPAGLSHSLATTFGMMRNTSNPYFKSPVAQIRMESPEDVSFVRVGGSPLQNSSSITSLWEANYNTAWLSYNRKHMRKLSVLARWDKQSSSYISNQLGTFSYQSLADFENNIASSFVRTLTPGTSRAGSAWNGAIALGNSWRPARGHHVMFGLRGEGTILEIGDYAPKVSELFGPSNRRAKDWHISPRIGYTTSIDTSGKWGNFQIGTGNFRGPIRAGTATSMSAQRGFPDTYTYLQCLNEAVPDWDWEDVMSPASEIPSECSPGTVPGTPNIISSESRAPDVMRFAQNISAPNVWRSSLSWDRSWQRSTMIKISGTAREAARLSSVTTNLSVMDSRGYNQPGTVDLNLRSAPAFYLGTEGERAIYTDPDDINMPTGQIAISSSRAHPELNRVLEQRYGLHNMSQQFTASVSSGIVSLIPLNARAYMINASYSWTRARQEGYGWGTDGNPNLTDWSRAASERRHRITSSIQYSKFGARTYTLSLTAQLTSGMPFTPMVNGDINGDGAYNDRAFISSDVESFVSSTSPSAWKCIKSQLNTIARANSCLGPWSGELNFYGTFSRIRWLNRLIPNNPVVSVNANGLVAATDRLIHGNSPKGWGNNASVDPNLLIVRGFDPATQEFQYDMNPNFGASSAVRSLYSPPFAIRVAISMRLGQFQHYSSRRFIKLAEGKDPATSIERIADQLAMISPDPLLRLLNLSERLLLTDDQVDSIEEFYVENLAYREEVLNRFSARIMALVMQKVARGGELDSLVRVEALASQEEIGRGEARYSQRILELLFPEQLEALPQALKQRITKPDEHLSF